MAPGGQRTFSLIPTTLVDSVRDLRPMTSKAAKKAYQKANRGPKITRAEQRRLDAEEREREKKEFEKQKAANKARAAREKKAEKEKSAKQERKKLGIPEPSKFVRASQPTISMFAKVKGGKRKWVDTESVGEDSEDTIVEDEVMGRKPPPTKRLAMVVEDQEGQDGNQEEENHGGVGAQAEPNKLGGGDTVNRSIQTVSQDPDSEDEFGEFPTFSQPGFLEQIDSPVLPSHKSVASATPEVAQHPNLDAESNLIQLPNRHVMNEDYLFDNSQHLSDMATAQLLSEEAEAVTDSGPIRPRISTSIEIKKPTVGSAPNNRSHQVGSMNAPISNKTATKIPLKSAMTHKQFKIPPLPARLPSKPVAISYVPQPPSRFSVRKAHKPFAKKTSNLPPTSTQAFLEDNLDDFLPSPSQELRELLDDVDADDLPSNTQIARELSPFNPRTLTVPKPPKVEENYDHLVCTQDLILSSQDMREISPDKPKPIKRPVVKQAIAKSIPQPAFQKQSFDASVFDEFPSTQELVLTPQDLKEIETPSRGPLRTISNLTKEMGIFLGETSKPKRSQQPKAAKVPPHHVIEPAQVGNYSREKPAKKPRMDQANPKPNLRSKRRFFEEKPTDLLQGTVHESKGVVQKQAPLVSSEPQRFLSLEEQEAASLEAAIQESKITAQKKPPPPQSRQPGTKRFFHEKETDLIQATIQESKTTAQKKPPHIPTSQNQPPNQPQPQRAPPANRFFQEKESDQLQAAIQESKMTAQKNNASYQSKRVPLKIESNNTVRSTRTLQRVQSIITDYGDDDLTEQDLLGLC